MSALWGSSYAGITTQIAPPSPALNSRQPAAGYPGAEAAAAAIALRTAAAAALAPPLPLLPPKHTTSAAGALVHNATALDLYNPSASNNSGSSGGDDADARRRRLDLEERYHLPFAPARVGWPDAPLLQLLTQQAEALGDAQLVPWPLGSSAPQQQQQGGVGGSVAGSASTSAASGSSSEGLTTALQHALAAAAAAAGDDGGEGAADEQPTQAPPPPASAGGAAPPAAPRVLPLPQASLTVGLGAAGDWLDVPTALLPLWQQLVLRPVSGPKPVLWYAICAEGWQDRAAAFLQDLGAAHAACHLGAHEPATAAISPGAPPSTSLPAPPCILTAPAVQQRQPQQEERWQRPDGGAPAAAAAAQPHEAWLAGLRHACRQLQSMLVLTPPDLR